MANELVPVSALGVSKYADDDSFKEVASPGFLPRLMLMGSNSTLVKEEKIPAGRWGLVNGKNVEDLTKECNVIVLAWRPLALQIKGDEITSVYDVKSPEFTKIAEASGEQDSGCMYGAQFLVYVPAVKQFATLYFSSKTSRREAGPMKALMGAGATLKIQLIKNQKYSWHGPVVVACTAPLDLPNAEEMTKEVVKFNNPPANETETVPADAVNDR